MIHITSLPHTLLTKEYEWCAFTAKVYRLSFMLSMTDRDFTLYGSDIHDDLPGKYAVVSTEEDRKRWVGGPEWDVSQVFGTWDIESEIWSDFNAQCAKEIRERWQPGDVLGIISGTTQLPLVEALSDLNPTVVEWGIGYRGVMQDSHKVFESYAWAHHIAGRQGNDDIRYFDTVIPNCFDENDLMFSSSPGDYLLFIGRPTPRKGLDIIREIASRTDIPIKIAGQPGFDLPGAEHVGVVSGRAKAELFSGALAVLAPTVYLEPFGGVAVEAMLSGTPVITTDWGAFTETVQPGLSGYRCRTLAEFMKAIDDVSRLDRGAVQSYAASKYTLEVGAGLYSEYFDKLDTLQRGGWYEL